MGFLQKTLELLGLGARPHHLPPESAWVLARDDEGGEQRAILRQEIELQGHQLAAGSEVLFHPGGALQKCTLAAESAIDDLRAAAGSELRFWPEGQLAQLRLARDRTMQDLKLPAGAVLSFDMSSNLLAVLVEEDLELEGYPCKGGESIGITGWQLSSCTLSRKFTVDGIACEAGSRLELDPAASGRSLRRFTPCKAVEIESVKLKAGEEIELGERGRLIAGVLDRATSLQGLDLAAGSALRYYDEVEQLQSCTLASKTELDGLRFAPGELELYATGAPASGVLASAQTVDGVELAAGARIKLDPQGQLLEGVLAEDLELRGVPCQAGGVVRLLPYKDHISLATLSREHTVERRPCAAGHPMEISLTGRLKRFTPSRTVAIGRFRARAGEEVRLDDMRRPQRLVLDRAKRIYGQPVPAGSELRFAQDLPIAIVTLSDPASWGEFRLTPLDSLRLWNWGGAQVELASSRDWRGLGLEAGDELWLRRGGGLQYLKLGTARELRGWSFAAGAVLRFDKRGRLRGAELAEEMEIGGEQVAALSEIETLEFDKGEVVCRRVVRREGALVELQGPLEG